MAIDFLILPFFHERLLKHRLEFARRHGKPRFVPTVFRCIVNEDLTPQIHPKCGQYRPSAKFPGRLLAA